MPYNPDERVAACPDPDGIQISRVEVNFEIPVMMTQEQQRRLVELMSEVVQSPWNQPVDGIHWVGFTGGKLTFSKYDAFMFGLPTSADAPEDGEPTSDDNVLVVGSSAREFLNEKERQRVLKERA